MAKKAENTDISAAAPALISKPAATRARKHVKAQAVAVVAAVEEFVTAIVRPAKAEPAHEEISRLAYRLYLERGGQDGSQAEDWLRAEQTLRA